MQMKKQRGHLTEHPPKRRLRKMLARLSLVVFISYSCLIPIFAFTFAVFWAYEGLPPFFVLWREQPTTRLILTGIFFFLVVGVVGGVLTGGWFWIRFLRKEGFVKEDMVWPFGKRPWNQKLIPPSNLRLDRQEIEGLRSADRWITGFAFIWLTLWAFFGASVALATIIPLGLWVIGEGSVLHSVWSKSFTPAIPFAIAVICLFLGFLTGIPVGVFQWRRFVMQVLHFSDEEMQHP